MRKRAPVPPPSPWPRRLLVGAGLAGLLWGACSAPGTSPERSRPTLRGARIELPAGPLFAEIALLEDERRTGEGRLLELAESEDPEVRERAVEALGRLPHPGEEGVTAQLCRALADPEPRIRAAAAFALGVRADPASAGCLVNHRNDSDPAVRAAVARAGAFFEDPAVHQAVLAALADPDPAVRAEAAQATAMWDPDGPDAADVDRALVAAVGPFSGGAPRDVEPGGANELVWRGLYALSRRSAGRGRAIFVEHARSPVDLERLFAVRGLARTGGGPGVTGVFVERLADPDWRVVCEAVRGLEAGGDPEAAEELMEMVEHPSHHVRLLAVAALGELGQDTRAVRNHLWRGARDLSASVRAEAVVALASILPPGESLSAVEDHLSASDPIVRVGAARAAALLPDAQAVPLLTRLARDEDRRVAAAALAGLARQPAEKARPFLLSALEHPDNGLVLAAVTALREHARPDDVARLQAVLGRVRGDIAAEIALGVVESLEAIGGHEARRALEAALGHPNPYVRRRTRQTLESSFGGAPLPPPAPPPVPSEVPRPGRDYPRWRQNPVVEMLTSRGAMLFELFPAEAPVHVHSFLELAERGHYDGLIFHRVVPNFVIQGGDYRGDGNGGGSWRGEPLRHEFGPRKFGRGALGMPRYEDPDSGGSQFFVTHRPTPHLDGRYTLFGELRAGGEILDQIEAGDRILGVELLP